MRAQGADDAAPARSTRSRRPRPIDLHVSCDKCKTWQSESNPILVCAWCDDEFMCRPCAVKAPRFSAAFPPVFITPRLMQEADTAPHDCRHHETGTLWSAREVVPVMVVD